MIVLHTQQEDKESFKYYNYLSNVTVHQIGSW